MQCKRNFSAKREAIYKTLSSTDSHPTAEWIYEKLKTPKSGRVHDIFNYFDTVITRNGYRLVSRKVV